MIKGLISLPSKFNKKHMKYNRIKHDIKRFTNISLLNVAIIVMSFSFFLLSFFITRNSKIGLLKGMYIFRASVQLPEYRMYMLCYGAMVLIGLVLIPSSGSIYAMK